jgi:hypothetical protein
MTPPEFDASTSSPRRVPAGAEGSSQEFYASVADVTNEQHQNMAGLVQAGDFNAEVIVRFLRGNGIEACVDESTGGFRYRAADAEHASNVLFACVCLRASISYALEAAFWCVKAKR